MIKLFALLRYLRDDIGPMVFSLLLLLSASALNLAQPRMVEWAIDMGVSAGDARSLVLGALGIAAAALLSAGLHIASGVLLVRAGQGLAYRLRNDLYRKVTSLSFANLDRWRTGQLLVRINSDVNTVRMFVRMGLMMMINSIVMIAGSLTMMHRTHPQLARIMFVILPATLVMFFVFALLIRPIVTRVRARLDAVNNVLQENLAGAKVVRAFARHEYESERFAERNGAFYRVSLTVGYISALAYPFLFMLGQLAIVLITWSGGAEIIDAALGNAESSLTLGQLLAFTNYALLSMWPIMALGLVLQFFAVASASALRIDELLGEKPTVAESATPHTPSSIRGEIELKDVCFAYEGVTEGAGEASNAIEHVSLRIEAGTKVGILGRTGSGKSTLATLIPRYYDVVSGAVLIDGVDVRRYSIDSLRRNVVVVMQESLLLSGSIAENIRFGVDPAQAGEKRLREAARVACAQEFIDAKEAGWSERVAERGVGLSGGQRQRVSIARAVAADPQVLILDDVTSAVDARTEREITANLFEALAKKTVLIISQRVNSIMHADRIVVMDNGMLVGSGTHDQLLQSSEIYREIYQTQTAELRT